jgi:hypothetical protein
MNCGVTVAVFLAVTVSLVLSGKISLFIYLFIYYLMMMAVCQTIWCRIIEFLVNNELNRLWKDMIVP